MRNNDIRIVFIGGVHGVGKTLFAEKASQIVGVSRFSASSLISEQRKAPAAINKRVRNVGDNQTELIAAIEAQPIRAMQILLDGHFCVLDSSDAIRTVPIETFQQLAPVAVVVLLDEVERIQKRLQERDHREFSVRLLADLQNAEREHAEVVCKKLRIPICPACASESHKALEFVAKHINKIT